MRASRSDAEKSLSTARGRAVFGSKSTCLRKKLSGTVKKYPIVGLKSTRRTVIDLAIGTRLRTIASSIGVGGGNYQLLRASSVRYPT
jgi:hypothetical protein